MSRPMLYDGDDDESYSTVMTLHILELKDLLEFRNTKLKQLNLYKTPKMSTHQQMNEPSGAENGQSQGRGARGRGGRVDAGASFVTSLEEFSILE